METDEDYFVAIASQTKSVYRTGQPKDCSRKFSDFKFCMSIKSLTEEKKEEVWILRRAEWWAGRRMERSSEDVWKAKKLVLIFNSGVRGEANRLNRGIYPDPKAVVEESA